MIFIFNRTSSGMGEFSVFLEFKDLTTQSEMLFNLQEGEF